MSDLEIRPVRPGDLPSLANAGEDGYFADRLAKQHEGHGVLLGAWRTGQAIGSAYLWLDEAEEPEIRQHLPNTPLITHVEIFDADERNRGFGTELMDRAEQMLWERGYTRVALAVEVSNDAAARLYRRRGYQDWGHDTISCMGRVWEEDGTFTEYEEKCYVLTKKRD
ncbi:MAG TPA: GNAT family N-acetyltransferase [Kutzneria sp.]|jgi:GNAT superfamily N-acetyltransferase|nr:GNAT family N-acetyltransferase [Kutzneria sp.]